MYFYYRCKNCGKVVRYDYPTNNEYTSEGILETTKQVKEEGWVFEHGYTFCSHECESSYIKHWNDTWKDENLEACYNYQESLKGLK